MCSRTCARSKKAVAIRRRARSRTARRARVWGVARAHSAQMHMCRHGRVRLLALHANDAAMRSVALALTAVARARHDRDRAPAVNNSSHALARRADTDPRGARPRRAPRVPRARPPARRERALSSSGAGLHAAARQRRRRRAECPTVPRWPRASCARSAAPRAHRRRQADLFQFPRASAAVARLASVVAFASACARPARPAARLAAARPPRCRHALSDCARLRGVHAWTLSCRLRRRRQPSPGSRGHRALTLSCRGEGRRRRRR